MTRHNRAILCIILGLALMAGILGYIVGQQAKVIADQREYIELGCLGRYQGAE